MFSALDADTTCVQKRPRITIVSGLVHWNTRPKLHPIIKKFQINMTIDIKSTI